MIFAVFLFLVEGLLVNLIFQPNGDSNMGAVSIVFLLINIVVVFIAIGFTMNDEDSKKYKGIIMSSFIVRILILLWDVYARGIYILPNSEADAEWYHKYAVKYAFGSRMDMVNNGDYSFYVSKIYRLIGDQKITIQFLHVFFAICSIILIYRILTMFEVSDNVKKTAMIFAAFLPNSMMITTFFLQEGIIAFFIILSLYFFAKWWRYEKVIYFLAALLLSLMASFLHMGGIVPFIAYIIMYMFIGNKERKFQLTFTKAVLGIVLIVVALVVMSSFGDTIFAKIGGEVSADSIIKNSGQTDVVTSADYLHIGIQGLPSSLDLIVNSPIRMLYFIFAPVPWMWRGFNDIFAFAFSTLFYIFAIVVTIQAIKAGKKLKNEYGLWSFFMVLIVMCVVAMLMFGWGVSNTGTAIRHREKFTYVFVVLYGIASEIKVRAGAVDDGTEENINNSTDLQCRKLS